MQALIATLVLLILGTIACVIWGKTRATASVMTGQDKDELKDSMTALLTAHMHRQVSRSDNLMTFEMDKGATLMIALLLLSAGLIPGILYLILSSRTRTLTVQFTTLQGQQGWNVRIRGQRSVVNRLRKVVDISLAALPPGVVQPLKAPAIGHNNVPDEANLWVASDTHLPPRGYHPAGHGRQSFVSPDRRSHSTTFRRGKVGSWRCRG